MRRERRQTKTAVCSENETVAHVRRDFNLEGTGPVSVFSVFVPFLSVTLRDKQFDPADPRDSHVVNPIPDLKLPTVNESSTFSDR